MDSLDDVIRRSGADAYVAFGSSQNADIRYLTRFRTEDPFVYIKKPGEKGFMVIGQMEYERAMRESIAAVMTRGESGLLDIIKEEPVKYRAYAKMIANHAGPRILIPASFPYGIGHELESFCEVILDPVRSRLPVQLNQVTKSTRSEMSRPPQILRWNGQSH